MKQLLLFAGLVFLFITAGCKTNSLSGIYVCDASQKKPDSVVKNESYEESTMDMTCSISELNFKGNSTVTLKIAQNEVTSSYIIDREYVRIKGDKGDFLFKIIDGTTLKADGFPAGTYHKK